LFASVLEYPRDYAWQIIAAHEESRILRSPSSIREQIENPCRMVIDGEITQLVQKAYLRKTNLSKRKTTAFHDVESVTEMQPISIFSVSKCSARDLLPKRIADGDESSKTFSQESNKSRDSRKAHSPSLHDEIP